MTPAIMFTWSLVLRIFTISGMAAYKLAIESLRSARWNHILLIVIAACAVCGSTYMLLPAGESGVTALRLTLPDIAIQTSQTATEKASAAVNPFNLSKVVFLLSYIYIAGVAFMLFRLANSIRRLMKIKRHAEQRTVNGHRIYVHGNTAFVPCSFASTILIPRSMTGEELLMAVEHEYAHCVRLHWFEQIFAEILTAIAWYNPAVYALRNALRDVHEYEADKAVIDAGYIPEDYQMLLIKAATGKRFELLANNLNNSSLKKRIIMMKPTRLPGLAAICRTLVLLPAMAAAFSAAALLPLNAMTATHAATATETALTAGAATSEETTPVSEPEVMPQYPGGIQAMIQYLTEHLKYPENVKAKEARVVVSFIVEANGSISNFDFIKKSDEEAFNEAALDVLRNWDVKWTPGKKDGNNVRVTYAMPINFKKQ